MGGWLTPGTRRRGTAPRPTGVDLVVARVDGAGVLDPSFGPADAGTPGVVVHDLGGSVDTARAMVLQPDGKILIAGTTSFGTSPDTKVALTRLGTDGALDATYGGGDGGAAGTVRSFDGESYGSARALVPLASNRFVVAWNADHAYLSRVDAPGALDRSFGIAGKAQLAVPGAIEVFALAAAEQADGKIVAVGAATINTPGNSTFPLVVARFDANGTIDATFGTGGYVVTSWATRTRSRRPWRSSPTGGSSSAASSRTACASTSRSRASGPESDSLTRHVPGGAEWSERARRENLTLARLAPRANQDKSAKTKPMLAQMKTEADAKGSKPDTVLSMQSERTMSRTLKRWLRHAKIDRPELFADDATRQALRFHDLRDRDYVDGRTRRSG